MRQQIVVYVIIVLVGLGIGTGAGMLITKSKVDKSKAAIADLQSSIQKSEMMAQKRIQNADEKISNLNTQLTMLKTELEQLRSVAAVPEKTTPAENTNVKITAAAPMNNTQTTPTTVYIVKEGDSLWKIAESHLGDGNRYTEIIKLNPDVSPNGYLAVGTKLKIPTK